MNLLSYVYDQRDVCYFSCSESRYNTVKSLADTLNDDQFKFKCRISPYDFFKSDEDEIKSSKLFIAFVSHSYFDYGSKSMDEYAFASEFLKPMLCIFTPEISLTADYINGNTLLKEMTAFRHIKLPFNCFMNGYWAPDVINEIRDKVYEIINENLKDQKAIKEKAKSITTRVHNLKLNKQFQLPNELFSRSTILSHDKIAILCYNTSSKTNFVYTFDSKTLQYQRCILDFIPRLIVQASYSRILVLDDTNGDFVLFDSSFMFLKREKLPFTDYIDMTVDETTGNIYFITAFDFQLLTIFNQTEYKIANHDILERNTGKIDPLKFKPRHIKVFNDQVFILNACSIRLNKDREIKNIESGASHIYILDKDTLMFKQMIDFNNWAQHQPWGLFVDKDSNIYTTVFQIEDKKRLSKERYLCKIDKYFTLISCTVISQEENNFLPNDIFIINDKFIFFKENKLVSYDMEIEMAF